MYGWYLGYNLIDVRYGFIVCHDFQGGGEWKYTLSVNYPIIMVSCPVTFVTTHVYLGPGVYHTKRDLTCIILKGTWHVPYQKETGVYQYHTMWDHTCIIPKGSWNVSYQKGVDMYHTKRELTCIIPKGSWHVSYQKGVDTYHTKRDLTCTLMI